jgi:hypothetical protein
MLMVLSSHAYFYALDYLKPSMELKSERLVSQSGDKGQLRIQYNEAL